MDTDRSQLSNKDKQLIVYLVAKYLLDGPPEGRFYNIGLLYLLDSPRLRALSPTCSEHAALLLLRQSIPLNELVLLKAYHVSYRLQNELPLQLSTFRNLGRGQIVVHPVAFQHYLKDIFQQCNDK